MKSVEHDMLNEKYELNWKKENNGLKSQWKLKKKQIN